MCTRSSQKRSYYMALRAQLTTFHHQIEGNNIRHPPSTNFEDDFETPKAKRLKRYDSIDSALSRRDDSEEEKVDTTTPQGGRREIADSEAETDEDAEHAVGTQQTDLESVLPTVKTDEDAIAEYEATRASGLGEIDLHGRLGQRKWVQGKSSIYVDAFNLALETVLEDEAHLFDEAEMAVFEQWSELSYEGQYL